MQREKTDGLVYAEEIAEQLAAALEDPTWSPPVLPEVAMKLVALTRQPTSGVADAARVLAQDPALAAQLVRRANSAVFVAAGRVKTVRDAAVRVGIDGVRNLALEIALSMRVFRAAGYQDTADALRRRAIAVATLAGVVARAVGLPPGEAFLCGLLSDLGLVVGLMLLGERTQGGSRPDLATVWPALLERHEQFSAHLAARWNLDPETATVIGHHHGLMVDGEPHPMVAVLIVAEWMADRFGAGLPHPPGASVPPRASDDALARSALGLEGEALEALLGEGQRALRELAISASLAPPPALRTVAQPARDQRRAPLPLRQQLRA